MSNLIRVLELYKNPPNKKVIEKLKEMVRHMEIEIKRLEQEDIDNG